MSVKAGFGERAQRLALDDQHVAAHDLLHAHADPHARDFELAVGRRVLAEREQRGVLVGGEGSGTGAFMIDARSAWRQEI